MGYIGMCGPKGHGFSAVLVINRVLFLAILLPFKGQVTHRVTNFWYRVGKIADVGHE